MSEYYIIEEYVDCDGGYIAAWGGDAGGIFDSYESAKSAMTSGYSGCDSRILYVGHFQGGSLVADKAIAAVKYVGIRNNENAWEDDPRSVVWANTVRTK